MKWSKRTVNDDLRVDKYTVNDIIVNYVKDKFFVNRRYQRKLVWGIDEKRLLIDSILKRIPLPAVLIAQYKLVESNTTILEIVDGMQRLDAIISFVLGKFEVEYDGKLCYFDPYSNNETFNLVMSNKLTVQENLIPKDICQEFCRYELPAIITGQDDETIELIFSRINSTGKKISAHDLRQSMSTGEFPDLVRRIASRVRGDYTHDDRICLCDMPKISVGFKKYGYGVDMDDVFWRRHDLINSFNLKESKDEEIIEALVATVLLKDEFKKTKKLLDDLYNRDSILGKKIEAEINKVGKEELENRFSKIFDLCDMIFSSVNSNFSSYLFNEKKISNKDECFKILFLALYELCSQGYVVLDPKRVANSIKDANSIFSDFIKYDKIDYTKVGTAVRNLYKILRPSFSLQITTKDDVFTLEIDKRLTYSKIERQMTEFKVCISNFNSSKINYNTIHDIAKALVGMANINNSNEEGLVIVGIADNKEAYDDWYKVFKEQSVIINQHYVPGVSCEAKKLCGNVDSYYRYIRGLIQKEPISNKLKQYILETFTPFDYHGVELIVFKSKNMGETSTYSGSKYVRHSNETIRI